MAASTQNKDESVADILSAIKNIVEGGNNNTVEALDGDDDLLELTDVVEELHEPEARETPRQEYRDAPAAPSHEKAQDILDQIDSELSVKTSEPSDSQKDVLESMKEEIMHDHPSDFKTEQAIIDEPAPVAATPEYVAEPVAQTAPEPQIHAQPATEPQQTAPKTDNVIKTFLLSAEKAQKSSLAIKSLLDNIPKTEINSPSMRNGTTIEDLLVESLKPLLKEWLDQNLETIVRDVVEREIKKLVPKED